jgi:hypothetical protein
MKKNSNKLGTETGVFSFVDNIKFEELNDGAGAMSEIQVFPDAVMYHPSEPEEPMVFDHKFREGMIKSFEESGIHPPIDFNHGSSLAITKEAGESAGWIIEMENREEGLFALVEWTDKGLDAIKGKPPKYKYLSPEWSTHQWNKKNGEVIAQPKLYAAALCSRPFLEGTIAPVAATEPQPNQQIEEVNSMDNENQVLAEENTTAEINEENTEIETENVTDENTETETATIEETAELAQDQEITNQLASETARADALQAALNATQERERNDVVENAMQEGRVVPSMLEAVQKYADTLGQAGLIDGGVTELRTFIEALPRQTRPEVDGGNVAGDIDTKELSDTDREVCRMLGIPTDLVNKYKDVEALTHDNLAVTTNGELKKL